MSSLTDKIQQLFTTKQRIKSAIVAKGVKVAADVPFADYATKIEEIPQMNPDDWKPHPDWPDISEVADNEIKLLVADGSGIAFATTVANNGTFSIDWGDGTIEHNCASGSTKEHQYVPGSGTPCSIGYSTYVVRIFNATDNITLWKLARHSFHSGIQYQNILWININAKFITSYSNFLGNNIQINCRTLESCIISSLDYCTSIYGAFTGCTSLKNIVLPKFGNVTTTCNSAFSNCISLTKITLPDDWNNVIGIQSMFESCYSLTDVKLPSTWGKLTQLNSLFYNCQSLKDISIPNNWGNVTMCTNLFASCYSLISVVLPLTWGNMQYTDSMFSDCYNLSSINLPVNFGNLFSSQSMFNRCFSLRLVNNISSIGSLTSHTNIDRILAYCHAYDSDIIINSLLQNIGIYGSNLTDVLKISSIRLTNPGSLFAGSSPQVNVSYTSLPQAALVDLFNDLPVLAGKTINITGCTGSAALTPEERAIATNKGWTIIG